MGKSVTPPPQPPTPAETPAPAAAAPSIVAPDAAAPTPAATPAVVVIAPPTPPRKPTRREVEQLQGKELWAKAPMVIFIDTDKKEYPAQIVPLPVNKLKVATLPGVKDPRAELDRISTMDPLAQMEAFQDYQARMANGVPHLVTGRNRFRPLINYRGVLMQAMEVNGRLIPAPDLLVDFSPSEDFTQVIYKRSIPASDFVAVSPKGAHQVPNWKIVEPTRAV